MKDDFFQKELNATENQPFMTTVTAGGRTSQTIAQIREGEHGELSVTLQGEVGSLLGPDDTETTITLPSSIGSRSYSSLPDDGGRTIPLHPRENIPFLAQNGESERTINAASIALLEPVRAKTLTLLYNDIGTED